MKKKIIFKSIILLLVSSFIITTPLKGQKSSTPSQVTKNTAANLEEKKVPFYQGLNIGIDLLGIGSKLFGGNILSSE
ncbi:MAG: DUF6048 family protein, partial [Phocaeicola sp.]